MNCNNDGFKEEGITCPSKKGQIGLLNTCYRNCNLDPQRVTYVEAHGTGTTFNDF